MEKMLLFMVSSQTLIFQATEQEYEKEKLNERIAKLSGGVAVIQVKPNVKP
jgi:chaperonin GroEL (HSP60 family)